MDRLEIIDLKQVIKTDYRFLYQILKEREINTNISHKKMPTYNEHIDFVQSKPYSKWYIIYFGRRKVGSVYISKQNEIGIFIKKKFLKNGIGTKVLKIILEKNPKKRFLANINPKNKKSIKFFKKNGFKLLQKTYELQVKN
jgi:RimJ/RimL family protein N-acetyltransferase